MAATEAVARRDPIDGALPLAGVPIVVKDNMGSRAAPAARFAHRD